MQYNLRGVTPGAKPSLGRNPHLQPIHYLSMSARFSLRHLYQLIGKPILAMLPWWIGSGFCWAQDVADEFIPEGSRSGDLAVQVDRTEGISERDLEFFEKRIRPILLEHCYECHSGEEVNGGLSVESRQQLLAGGDSGPAIRLDLAAESLLIAAVSYENEHLQMPPQGRLAASQVELLREWIERGAPDPRGSSASQKSGRPQAGMSLEEGRQFWSFLPVANAPLPKVKDPQWLQSPIDSFVLSKLEGQGIPPAPMADRSALVRRLYLNLTGLPPSHEEVQLFMADTSPDAYEKLVEKLLATPQYGVRWGRHWLDVARYADSNGLDENIAYGNAWRYRDYVIQAFNSDKPYHRFVLEQVAGDLLPEASDESKIATGFLALGAKVLAEPDMEKLAMDTIDEQIDTIGKAFLGLSLGCARCHDHKFDPVTQRDYYALAAIFKGTRTFSSQRYGAIKYWYEHDLADDAERQAIQKVEAEIAAAKSAASQFKSQAMSKIRKEAQEQAATYLMAAAQLSRDATLVEVAAVAEPLGLHSRILYHCRKHVEIQRAADFYSAWHRLSSDPEAVGKHYQDLFSRLEAALDTAGQSQDQKPDLGNPELEQAKTELNDPSGFLVVPPQPEYAFDSETLQEYYRLMEEARVLESHAADLPAAMGVSDATPTASIPIHIRGSHLNLGEPVARGIPSVMLTSAPGTIFPDHQSGRMELANWLASTANPLTARVLVNRIWGWHFGRPLVSTTENFGVLGQKPTHPELLDWLSYRFMQSGWSIKHLHRLILNSSTYKMSSEHPNADHVQTVDPENELLWKFRIQRLDAEQLRDSVLAASGQIDLRLHGKSVPLRNHQFVFDHTSIDHTRYDSLRRASYLPIIRNNLYTLLEQFDFPDPTMPTGHRQATTVAPQSLLMLNADIILGPSGHLANHLIATIPEPEARLEALFLRLVARPPTESQRLRCISVLNQLTGPDGLTGTADSPESEGLAWALITQALMASNEFLYVR